MLSQSLNQSGGWDRYKNKQIWFWLSVENKIDTESVWLGCNQGRPLKGSDTKTGLQVKRINHHAKIRGGIFQVQGTASFETGRSELGKFQGLGRKCWPGHDSQSLVNKEGRVKRPDRKVEVGLRIRGRLREENRKWCPFLKFYCLL